MGKHESLKSSGHLGDGCAAGLASSYPSRGDSFLLKAFGDESMAQMTRFLRSSRVGAFADDADTVAAMTARLAGARVLSAADHVAAGLSRGMP